MTTFRSRSSTRRARRRPGSKARRFRPARAAGHVGDGRSEPGALPGDAVPQLVRLRSDRYVAGGRATALAIDPNCSPGHCRLWVFAAGGGVWRTKNALSGQPNWEFLSGGFGINSGSSIALDPNDPTGDTLYVGTGEANASGDSAAGVGHVQVDRRRRHLDRPARRVGVRAAARSAASPSSPAAPNTIYAATTRGVRGVSSVNGGARQPDSGRGAVGPLQVDRRRQRPGRSCTTARPLAAAVRHGGGSDRRRLAVLAARRAARRARSRRTLTSSTPARTAAASGARTTPARPGCRSSRRSPITRTTPTCGPSSRSRRSRTARRACTCTRASQHRRQRPRIPPAQLFRSDDVATGVPVFSDLSSSNPANPGYATYNICTGQCWYDNFVYTPAGHPDIVYVGGSYSYGERFSNKRGVVLSTDAGVTRHGHDDGRHRSDPPERPASRSARARHQPGQPVPVLRGQRRRR